jgi:hypothetical protein
MEKTFKDLKIKEWEYKPLTIGLWRPYQVEVGFIEDYIKRWGTDEIILY